MAKKTYLFTKEGFDNLKKELERLTTRRPQVVINLSNAREQGDLSENAGYHAAKDELSQIDSRIRELNFLIRNTSVANSTQSETVEIGTTVRIFDGEANREFKIVNRLEANPAQGKMSDVSPIGSALIGKKKGAKVTVQIPSGQSEFEIIEIFSQ